MSRVLQLAWKTFRPRKPVPGRHVLDPSETVMRVNVADLDILWHVNNGTYLQMADVARWNYIADLGGMERLNEQRWYPVVAASTVKYRRSLQLGERFRITTSVLGWDERVVYLEQVFRRGDELCATAWVAGRFLSRDGERIAPQDVVALLGDAAPAASPPLPAEVAAWARALDVAPR
ncbi:thioesterase superfamily protein [Xylanimonas cellulosilytica DSM 15894]|uniref:Thioesterase superfamily protein n=1 Tax=Xylanimonas cellulosilytica (strain DSM 15894 / JCM 12276 / CECT 5975 / KCTC 9989 / LMG 20990 / NBRC 107835 / XIL07) TaxID=446471 RepID=D1BTR0_XYLCX|nr:acyl-CoA thioesterase [Xylanimonas cellulosilytica]ACZ31039.1 thioesterase superfamily protein [Xylanimonas cellulosilytica DSM 15894]